MKKTYIAPYMKVVDVDAESIICLSNRINGEYDNGLTVGSRRGDWDDEDEDEDEDEE